MGERTCFRQPKRRYAVLLALGDENSGSGFSRETCEHGVDIAVAQRIAAGDEESLSAFLSATRPLIDRVATNWCHRIAPDDHCRYCSAGAESDCRRFSRAEPMIEDRIRQGAVKAYRGQGSLATFVECLVCSDWWFMDYADATAEILTMSNREPVTPDRGADLVHAWAVLANSESAWKAFLDSFNDYVEQAARAWCHRTDWRRICKKCKPEADRVDSGCDAFSDAYLYILNRLRYTALASYTVVVRH